MINLKYEKCDNQTVTDVYIHYGHKEFNINLFEPIKNLFYRNKPLGGLWASPIKSENNWKSWCEMNSFRVCEEENSFCFILSPDANIYRIDESAHAMQMPQIWQRYPEWFDILRGEESFPDFEYMLSCGIDAILYNLSNDDRLYWILNGWDCDSLLVMNPDVIIKK